MQSLGFGERDGKLSDRILAIRRGVSRKASAAAATSEHVIQDMWEKMGVPGLARRVHQPDAKRRSVTSWRHPGGKDFLLGMLDECSAVATRRGSCSETAPFFQRTRGIAHGPKASPMTASMFRDNQSGARPVEADHVIGDLIARGGRRQSAGAAACASPIRI